MPSSAQQSPRSPNASTVKLVRRRPCRSRARYPHPGLQYTITGPDEVGVRWGRQPAPAPFPSANPGLRVARAPARPEGIRYGIGRGWNGAAADVGFRRDGEPGVLAPQRRRSP